MDMLANAQRWLSDVRQDSLATENTITYIVRRTGERINMNNEGVVVGNNAERLDASVASSMDVEERDFIIPVTAFEQRTRPRVIRPVRGDMIEEVDEDGNIFAFRIVPQGGEVSWEWHDRQRTAYRVHTQLIDER